MHVSWTLKAPHSLLLGDGHRPRHRGSLVAYRRCAGSLGNSRGLLLPCKVKDVKFELTTCCVGSCCNAARHTTAQLQDMHVTAPADVSVAGHSSMQEQCRLQADIHLSSYCRACQACKHNTEIQGTATALADCVFSHLDQNSRLCAYRSCLRLS